jgi:hypothetical protein
MPESPQWLFAYKRYDEAEVNLKKMASWNGVPAPRLSLKKEQHLLPKDTNCSDNNATDSSAPTDISITIKVPVSDLYRDVKLRTQLLISSLLWLVDMLNDLLSNVFTFLFHRIYDLHGLEFIL